MRRWHFLILCILVPFVNSLDLLGLSISVPAIESDVALGNVLSGSSGTGHSKAVRPSTPSTRPRQSCKRSITTVNGGQPVCEDTLIFEENFSKSTINNSNWIKEQYIPRGPDFEFVSYENHPQNSYISRGWLCLKPTPRDDPFISSLDLSRGCTGNTLNKVCTLGSIGTIVPPIVSAKIRSRLSFLYGKIEIRAQLPRGDWIYPQLYLEPKSSNYGDGYESGRMWIAYARGNRDLERGDTGEQIGNSILYSGPVLSATEPVRTDYATVVPSKSGFIWADAFHVFSLTWSPGNKLRMTEMTKIYSPDGVSVEVDGVEQGFINPNFASSDVPYAHLWNSTMAPFDKEFVISMGVGAGGHSDFPNECVSSGKKKPWKRSSSKATLLFHQAAKDWYGTWAGENAALKIDYVKVWSL